MVGNKAQKAVAAALTGMLALGSVGPAIAGTQVDNGWYRINGDHVESYALQKVADEKEAADVISGTKKVDGVDRYDTMFDAINYNIFETEVWKDGVTEVVLVSGTSQSDALVAAGYAGDAIYGGAPVITTPGDKLGTQADRAITYFAKNRPDANKDLIVTIIGGEAAVSKDVEDAVADIDDVTVDRIAGEDRVETSLLVAKEMNWLEDKDEATAYVANGWAWADALSVSSFAYRDGQPILLTGQDGKLTDSEKDYLSDLSDTVELFVVGGPAEGSVQDAYDAGFSRAKVTYKGGKDRYETSALVVDELAFSKIGVSGTDLVIVPQALAIASGKDAHWPDALIGGAFVGANQGVLVLADEGNVVALEEAQDNKSIFANKYFIGGENALSARFARRVADKF